MKIINTPAIITSIRSKVDGSLGLSLHTPELVDKEKIAFLNLQGKNVNLLIEPESGGTEQINVEAKLEGKRLSQRLRSVLFVWWEQQGRPDTFDSFYSEKMDKFIEHVKEKLD